MLKNGTHTLMQRKMAEGIGFFALGNEPPWALDIDFDKGMRFKSLTELPELNTPSGREDKAQDADVTRFFAETEAGTLIVTVLRGQCTDTMSGEMFPFRVKIDVKRSVDADYKTVEGCGRYVVDYRLDDIWVLARFGDRTIEAEDFTNGPPNIEFHLRDNRLVGSTGCNRINGRFESRGAKISLGRLATTRVACPAMAFEQELLSVLADKTLRYTFNEGRLILTDDKNLTLVFKKTD
ncbi:MAG: META domain-containing protein [Desulfobacterales bacterium]